LAYHALNGILGQVGQNFTLNNVLIYFGFDPSGIALPTIFNRSLDILLANVNLANALALIGAALYVATWTKRTIVPLRVIGIISGVFFIIYGVLADAMTTLLIYLLSLPINIVRLRQMIKLVRRARLSAQGNLSFEWLQPFMTPRKYRKGDVLFCKGDPADELLYTVAGRFLVKEIAVEILPGEIMGELGFVDPKNKRTQTIECMEDGEVLTITYDRLLELYFQNPEFGYYLLRLSTGRLRQNNAALERLLEDAVGKLKAYESAAKTQTDVGAAPRPSTHR
jgi:CRP-like cAMP-binding protein